MKVLSLFDGMSCGMLAMMAAGIDVEAYDAYEIDKYAVTASKHNFPQIEQHGDVFEADFTRYQGYDFLVGGSPCTYWSIAQRPDKRERPWQAASAGSCSVNTSGHCMKRSHECSSTRTIRA